MDENAKVEAGGFVRTDAVLHSKVSAKGDIEVDGKIILDKVSFTVLKGDKIDNATEGAPWHSYIHYSFSVSIASKQRSR